MAVTFGFYNSKNGDRTYNAEQMSSLFGGIIKDGIFADYPAEGQHLKPTHVGGFVMSIGPGRAWFENTWTNNDSPLEIEMSPPEAVNDRVDLIVLEINKTNEPDNSSDIFPYTVPGRSNKFVVVKGTPAPAAEVQRPALRNGNGIYQHPIALVRMSPSSPTSIAYFNELIGTGTGSPYVLNAIQNVSAEGVISSWTNALNAAIDSLVNGAHQDINTAIQEYFSDPTNVYQVRLDEMEEEFSARLSEDENDISGIKVRKYIWLLDRPVSAVKNTAATYSKEWDSHYTSVNASPAHNIYPDFILHNDFERPHGYYIDALNSPKAGDIVIGSNGYYAVIAAWSYGYRNYSMIISSTGESVVDYSANEFKAVFYGGHNRDGDNISSTNPAGCSKTFGEIKAAYAAGHQIDPYVEFTEIDQSQNEHDFTIRGTCEYHETDQSGLVEIIAKFECLDNQGGRMYTHVYDMNAYGLTEWVL